MTAAGRCAAPDQEGGGFAAADFPGKAAAPGLGDAPREGMGPPLSVKAGPDRRATAGCQAARHMDTPGPALSAEPPAAPWGRRSGQAPACPARGAARPVTTGPRAPAGAGQAEVNWRSIVRRKQKLHESTIGKCLRFQGIATVLASSLSRVAAGSSARPGPGQGPGGARPAQAGAEGVLDAAGRAPMIEAAGRR